MRLPGAAVAGPEADERIQEKMVKRIRKETTDDALAEPTFRFGVYVTRPIKRWLAILGTSAGV